MKTRRGITRIIAALLVLTALLPVTAFPEEDVEIEEILFDAEGNIIPEETPAPAGEAENPARADFIDDIIAAGKKVFDEARGKLQRAQYKEDIYICKNFTVYVFRQARDKYRMAEFPDVKLKIPDNLPSAECKPYYYGYCWKEVSASDGNPFEIAAQFLYDKNLSEAENREKAMEFMRQIRRGDYFQMTAEYSHGNGAHSAVMIADYNPETDTVRWMDSNMVGKKINGVRYGKVQFDEEEKISWWVDAFCKKKRGATIYRLRQDIIYAE